MNTSLNKAYILIDKFHSGQASAAEIDLLNKWKDESNHNFTIYNEIIQILDVLNSYPDWKDYDNIKGWDKILSNLKPKILSLSLSKIASIAAIFILVLTATFWVSSYNVDISPEEVINGNEFSFTVLEDGSELFLTDEAIININNFDGNHRLIQSTGSYFVNVFHDSKHPFKINMRDLDLEVKGTSFHIEESPESSILRVRDGVVEITTNSGFIYELKANEKLEIRGNETEISSISNFEWGLFSKEYDDESIFTLLNDISSRYGNLKINASGVDATCRVTTEIKHSTILEILEELSLIFSLDYTIKNGTIIVRNISC